MTTRRPFQFSIATLLALTGVVAVIIGIFFSEPTDITGAIVVVLLPALPALSITGCVNTKGNDRAFCIGAACVSSLFGGIFCAGFANVTMVPTFSRVLSRASDFRFTLLPCWVLMILIGLLCVAFRRLLIRHVDTEDQTSTDDG